MGSQEAWGAITPKTITRTTGEVYLVTKSTMYNYYDSGNGWVTNGSGGAITSNSYYTEKNVNKNSNYINHETEKSGTSASATGIVIKTADDRSGRFYFTGASKVAAFIGITGDSRTATIEVFTQSGNSSVGSATTTKGNGNYEMLTVNGLSATEKYYAKVTATNDVCLYAMKFWAPEVKLTSLSMTADKTSTLRPLEPVNLTLSFSPADATNKSVTWSFSDNSLATVTQTSETTAVFKFPKSKTGTVTATANDGSGKTASQTFTSDVISNLPENTLITAMPTNAIKTVSLGTTPDDIVGCTWTKVDDEGYVWYYSRTGENKGSFYPTKAYYQRAVAFKLDVESDVTIKAKADNPNGTFLISKKRTEGTGIDNGYYTASITTAGSTVTLPTGTYYIASYKTNYTNKGDGVDAYINEIKVKPTSGLLEDNFGSYLVPLSTKAQGNFSPTTGWGPNVVNGEFSSDKAWGDDVKHNILAEWGRMGIIANNSHYIKLNSGEGYTFNTTVYDHNSAYLVIDPSGPGWLKVKVKNGGNTEDQGSTYNMYRNWISINDNMAFDTNAGDNGHVVSAENNWRITQGYTSDPGKLYIAGFNKQTIETIDWIPYIEPTTLQTPNIVKNKDSKYEINFSKLSDRYCDAEFKSIELVYIIDGGAEVRQQMNTNKLTINDAVTSSLRAKILMTYTDPSGATHTIESPWATLSIGDPTLLDFRTIENGNLKVTTSNAVSVKYTIANGSTAYVTVTNGEASIPVGTFGTNKFALQAVSSDNRESAKSASLIIVDERAVFCDPDFEAANGGDYWDTNGLGEPKWSDGNGFNNCAERFQGKFDISQTLTGLTDGVYEITAQAFYRTGNYNPAYDAYAADLELKDDAKVLSYIYVNDYAIPVKNIFQQGVESTSALSGYISKGEGNFWYPDDMSSAADAFNRGLYTVKLVATVTGGTLKVGIFGNGEGAEDGRWTCWDNITLKKVSDVDATSKLQTLPGSYKWSYTNGKFGKVGTEHTANDIVDNGYLQYLTVSDGSRYVEVVEQGLYLRNPAGNGIKFKIPGPGTIKAIIYNTNNHGAADNAIAINGEIKASLKTGDFQEISYTIPYDATYTYPVEVEIRADKGGSSKKAYIKEAQYISNPGDLVAHSEKKNGTDPWTWDGNTAWKNGKTTYSTVLNNNTSDDDTPDIRIIADADHTITVSSDGYSFSSKANDDYAYLMIAAPVKGQVKIYTKPASGVETVVGKGLSITSGISSSVQYVPIGDVDADGLTRTVKLFTDNTSRMVYITADPDVIITKIEWIPGEVSGESTDLRPVYAETVWSKNNQWGGFDYDYSGKSNTAVIAPNSGIAGGVNQLNYGRGAMGGCPATPNATLLLYGGDCKTEDIGKDKAHPTYFTTSGNLMLNNTSNNSQRVAEFKVAGPGVVKVNVAPNGPTARAIDIAAYNHKSSDIIGKENLLAHSITTDENHDAGTASNPTANEQEHIMKFVRHQHNSYHTIYAYYDGPADVEQLIQVFSPNGGISLSEIHWYPNKTIYELCGNLSEEGCLKISDAAGNVLDGNNKKVIPDSIYINPRKTASESWMPTEMLTQKEYSFYAKVTTEKVVSATNKEPVWTTSQAGRKGANDKWIMVNDKVWGDQDQHTALEADVKDGDKYMAITGYSHPYTIRVPKRKVFENEADAETARWSEPKNGEDGDNDAWGILYVVSGTAEGNYNDIRRVEVAGPPTRLDVENNTTVVYLKKGKTASLAATPVTVMNDIDNGGNYGQPFEMKYVADPTAVTWQICDSEGRLPGETGFDADDVLKDLTDNNAIENHTTERINITAKSENTGTAYIKISVPGVYLHDYTYTVDGKTYKASAWVETTLEKIVKVVVTDNDIFLTRVMLKGEKLMQLTDIDDNDKEYQYTSTDNVENVDVTSPQVYIITGDFDPDKNKFEAKFSNNVTGNSQVAVPCNTIKKDEKNNYYVVFDFTKVLKAGLPNGNKYEHTNYDATHTMTIEDKTNYNDGSEYAQGGVRRVFVSYDEVKNGVLETKNKNIKDGDKQADVLTFRTVHDDSGTVIETFIYNASQRGALATSGGSNALTADVNVKQLLSEHNKAIPFTADLIKSDGSAQSGSESTATKAWNSNHRSYLRLNNFSTEPGSYTDDDRHLIAGSDASISIKPYNTMFGENDQKEAIDQVRLYFDIAALRSMEDKTGVVKFTVPDVGDVSMTVQELIDNNGIAVWKYGDKSSKSTTWTFDWKSSESSILGDTEGWTPKESDKKDYLNGANSIRWNNSTKLTAGGYDIAEFNGLDVEVTAKYQIATAFDYQTTADDNHWGPYHGKKYLWITKTSPTITIPSVKTGTTLELGVESHKPNDARGFDIKVDGTTLKTLKTDDNGKYKVLRYTIPENSEEEYVDVVLQATAGCHLYYITADVGTNKWVHDVDVSIPAGLKIDQIKIDYYSATANTKNAYTTFDGFEAQTFKKNVEDGIDLVGLADGEPGIKLAFRQNSDLRHFNLLERWSRVEEDYVSDGELKLRGEKDVRDFPKTALIISDDQTDPCEFYIYNKEHVANMQSIEFVYEVDNAEGQNNLDARNIFCTSDPRFNPGEDNNMVGYPLEDMEILAADYTQDGGNRTGLRKLVYRPEAPVNFAAFTLDCTQTGYVFVRKIIVRYENTATSNSFVLNNANGGTKTMGPSEVKDITRSTSGIRITMPESDSKNVAGYLIKRTSANNNTSQEIVLTSGEVAANNSKEKSYRLNSKVGTSNYLHKKNYTIRVLDENRMVIRQMAFHTTDNEMPKIKRYYTENGAEKFALNQDLRSEDPLTAVPDKVTVTVTSADGHTPENTVLVYTTDGSAPSVTFGGDDGREIVAINGDVDTTVEGVTFSQTALASLFSDYNNAIVIKALALPLTESSVGKTKESLLNHYSNTYGETSEITRANYTLIEPDKTFFTTARRDNDGNYEITLTTDASEPNPYDITVDNRDENEEFEYYKDKFRGAYQPKVDDNHYSDMPEIFTYGGYESYDNELSSDHKFKHNVINNEYWQVRGNDATPWRGLREIVAGDTYVMSPLEPFNEKAKPLYDSNNKMLKATTTGDYATKFDEATNQNVSTKDDAIRYFKGQFDYSEHLKKGKSYYRTWNLPCYGDYFRFEPDANGTLTVYVKQQGVLDQENGFLDDRLLRLRPVYILDEAGNTPAGITASTTSKVSGDWMTMKHTENAESKYLNAEATNMFKMICDQWIKNNTRKAGTNGDNDGDIEYGDRAYESQGVLVLYGDLAKAKAQTKRIKAGETEPTELDYTGIDRTEQNNQFASILDECLGSRGTGEPNGFMIISEGYVKYQFPVRAGKTYFMFASNGNLGFCSYTFDKNNNSTNSKMKNETELQEYTLTYADNASMTTLLTDCLEKENGKVKNGKTANVKLTRTFKNNSWSSLVLPFSVSMHQLREQFGDGVRVSHFNDISRVYNASYTDPNDPNNILVGNVDRIATRHHVHQMIVAGVPVFIRPGLSADDERLSADGTFTVNFKNVTIETDEVEPVVTNVNEIVPYVGISGSQGYLGETHDNYICTGSFLNDDIIVGDVYINESKGLFMLREVNNAKIQGTRCRITPVTTSPTAPTKLMLMNIVNLASNNVGEPEENGNEGGITTDVDYINVVTEGSLDKVYNLKGQIVRSSDDDIDSLPQGVYIINGVKHVVK